MPTAGKKAPAGKITAFIFDIDGTLIDSNEFHAAAWEQAFARHGKKISRKRIRAQMGKGGDQLLPEFLSKAEIKKSGKQLNELCGEIFKREYLSKVKPFPKVRALFSQIRKAGIRIALASSSKQAEVKQYEKIARIADLIEKETSADDAEESKPQPDIFQAAMKKLRHPKPHEVLVVGDTPFDALAARRAKLPVIGVLCGGFSKKILTTSGCRAVYKDPADLLKHLKTILNQTD